MALPNINANLSGSADSALDAHFGNVRTGAFYAPGAGDYTPLLIVGSVLVLALVFSRERGA